MWDVCLTTTQHICAEPSKFHQKSEIAPRAKYKMPTQEKMVLANVFLISFIWYKFCFLCLLVALYNSKIEGKNQLFSFFFLTTKQVVCSFFSWIYRCNGTKQAADLF